MTAITTVAELDALPVGVRVRDDDGDVWFKRPSELWSLAGESSRTSVGVRSEYLVKTYGPLVTDDDSSPLAMSKCVSDGCQSSHALPPGSSYACPDHSNHITAGRSR